MKGENGIKILNKDKNKKKKRMKNESQKKKNVRCNDSFQCFAIWIARIIYRQKVELRYLRFQSKKDTFDQI